MAAAAFAAKTPTPARASEDSNKRQRTDGGSKKQEKSERRALRKALAEIRRLTSEVEDCYIFPKADDEAIHLKAAKDLYNSKKPERDPKAEKGQPHPMGPNRWLLVLQLIEDSTNRYKTMTESVNKLKVGMPQAGSIHDGLVNLISKVSTGSMQLKIMESFVRYCETRTTKAGDQILHICCRDEICLEEDHDIVGLTGFTGKQIYTVIMFPFRAAKQTGTAPASSEERELIKLLKEKS